MSASTLLPTVAFAAGAGIATFFAPCAFPLLPGYIGYYLQHRDSDRVSSALLPAAGAAVGALVTLGAVGIAVFVAGQELVRYLRWFEPLAGVVLLVVGLLVVAGRQPTIRVPLPERPASTTGFVLFGGGYALAAAGCVAPVFLGVVAQTLTLPLSGRILSFGSYALGVVIPLSGVTLLMAAGVDWWRELGKYSYTLERVAGGLMILAGIGQLYLSLVVLDAF
ncbi:cytochrome C biogenesis protein [Haladaptatus sp. W1]|uniref:cytochrome c biogenesis CcdA family protein n=1 Tax=Haladaptatus sp. W1 TaxID=1897478 RepID=UPI0008497B96|nr:cytochrome c biogenesis protein CcdA [Haladaptatus sp. W1]ODR81534.1 cytochrome C biogenesis protein [Haladaptatus sp. W1]